MTKLTTDEEAGWAALENAMLTSLDDNGFDSLERSRRAAERKLARSGLSEAPIDRGAVKRFLLLYSKLERGQGVCIKASGIDRGMLLTAYDLWPEARFVRDYLAHRRHQSVAIDNEDLVDAAREGLRRVMTEDGSKLNANAIMFTLERLDAGTFGTKPKEKEGEAQVVYNIPNLTLNMIVAPGELPAAGGGAVIDVKPKEVECLRR